MSTPTGPISRQLFNAIRQVETGSHSDPENATGDGGKAIGPYQIHEVYWTEAKDSDPSLVANGETYRNCMGSGSFHYSERVMQAYMNRYAMASRIGHTPTDEDMARIHNGGPNGYKNPATLAYWEKVKKYL